MKPSLIKESIITSIKATQPAFLWGPPGVGKSDVVKQVADELFGKSNNNKGKQRPYLIDIRAILLDPVDLRGIPRINGDGKAHWCIPDFLPKDGEGILFLDELPAAPQSVQASCYQLVLDRQLGEYALPDGWFIVAAGNRETDRAVSHRMPSALANRFVHLNFEVDLQDWIRWALGNGIKTEIIGFLKFRPELLHQFDPTKNDKAFPTPRSWQFVSKILDANPGPETEFELISGTVGEGAAGELIGFLRVFRQLPSPDAVLMNPDNAIVPEDPSALYAICGALARKASENTIERIIKYQDRIPADFKVLLMREAVQQNESITRTRAYIEWASDNSEILV